jgi:arylsulfatase A-like enzyme
MKRICLIIFVVLAMPLTADAAEKPEKPNVLFIISDDLNTALSGFGHEQCKTPELDKLAKRGVKFENMHCQFPLCGPSRESIMSGLYPYTTGVLKNEERLRNTKPQAVTLPQAFSNKGYYAGRVSKIYHMGIPREIIAGTADSDDPPSWQEAINIKAPEHNAAGVKTNWSPKNKGSQTFMGVAASEGDSAHADGMAADHAIEILEKIKDKPFFLAVGFVRPHVPLVAPKKYHDIYNREDMIAPFVPKDDLNDVPQIIRSYKSNTSTYGVTPELHKGLLQAYYASVSYMDAQVGRLLKALKDNGLEDNTIVVFTSDHGYLLGHHNKFQKRHLFEESTRVPFIISVPWMKDQHGKGTMKITELIDLYPTLTELAGLPSPDTLHGTSLRPLLKNVNASEWTKDRAFTISMKGGESLRTKDWRINQWGFGEDGLELYDLRKDPQEFTNQADNPEYAGILATLKRQLEAKRDEAGYNASIKEKVNKANNKNNNKKKSRKPKKNNSDKAAKKTAQNQNNTIAKSFPELSGKKFSYQQLGDIGLEKGVTRRDPSDVIKVSDTYYVYYSRVVHEKAHLKASAYLGGTIWYATSKDQGRTWTEKGQALGPGKQGTFDSLSVFTPNIVKFKSKYYLYYTGVKPTNAKSPHFENNSTTDITALGIAVSNSPAGPFKRITDEPVLRVTPQSKDKNTPSPFDSFRIDDAALLVRDYDKDGDLDIWLYYKGRNIDHSRKGPGMTKMGLAIADTPESEHIRTNNGKPILSRSHEVMIWPHRKGIAAYASMTQTIEYAPDGIDFTSKPLNIKVAPKPIAPGCFRPDLTEPLDYGTGISWGIAMKNPGGPYPYLIRYEADLAVPPVP